jgi:lysophospholipase L1-like esterase
VVVVLSVVVGLSMVAGPAATSGATTATPESPPYYLALGGSGSVGFQPTFAHPHGQRTDAGYANDLAVRESSRWPGLALVKLGCPGTTTQTMIGGGGHCIYASGSQLQAALSFLDTHPSTVLITVDLGFNDVVRCMHAMEVNDACVDLALADVQSQLPQILAAVRRAAPAHAYVLGVGHYDPYLGDDVRGPDGVTFARDSLSVIDRLNDVLRAAYAQADVPMANVGAAFELGDRTLVDVAGHGRVPAEVARTCSLTWMCAAAPLGPNSHPNDDGYSVVSDALATALSDATSD